MRVLYTQIVTVFVNLDIVTIYKHKIEIVYNAKLLNFYENIIFFNILPYPVDQTSLCTNDFDPLVQEKVPPLLPLHPDTCIARQEYIKARGYYINFFVQYNNTYPSSVSIIVVYAPADYIAPTLPSATQQRNKARLLYSEIHELCHINQVWYVAQALQPDIVLSARPNDLWRTTLAGKEFIALTGFTKNSRGNWNLPRNSVYNDIYSIDPAELSAELCMSYMLEHIGVENRYNYWSWKKKSWICFTLNSHRN